jgi:hypothetical protein
VRGRNVCFPFTGLSLSLSAFQVCLIALEVYDGGRWRVRSVCVSACISVFVRV